MLFRSFRWLIDGGGLDGIQARNAARAARLYAAIDALDGFGNEIAVPHRSIMNVPFSLSDDAVTDAFLSAAGSAGLVGLKGHKSVGGCRASLYNAVPDEAVTALLSLMTRFAGDRHGG